MKKTIIIPLVALILFVSGCMSGTEETTTTQKVATTQKTPTTAKVTPKTEATPTTQKAGGLTEKITDIAEAMTSGLSYRCTYTYQNIQTDSWIRGEKFMSESEVEGEKSYALSDGKWMYTWGGGQPQGIKMNIAEVKKLGEAQAPGQQPTDPVEIAKSAANVECMPEAVPDSKFVPPKDVEFLDMTELLANLPKMDGGTIPNVLIDGQAIPTSP